MVLREVDFWPLSETPSFTSSMILQSCEKQQQKARANEFINPEEHEYNSTKLFARKTQIQRVSPIIVFCKGRQVTSKFTLQGRK